MPDTLTTQTPGQPPHTRPATPPVSGRRYVLPCTPLHHGGLYEYVLVTVEQARQWVSAGPVQCYLPPGPLLALARIILDADALRPVRHAHGSRRLPVMDYADDALIVLPEGWDWRLPRILTPRHVVELVESQAYTLGLLRRLA